MKLQDTATKIITILNQKGFNIETAQVYTKGQRVLMKKVLEDKIMFNQYFGGTWDSGIQLVFTTQNDKLKFKGAGKFGWRNDKYNTAENRKSLTELVSEVHKINISTL